MSIVVPDISCLRESNLLIPGKKPIGPVKIDWEHPLSKDISFCCLPGLLTYALDLVTGAVGTYAADTDTPFAPDQYGMAFQTERVTGVGYNGHLIFTNIVPKSPAAGATQFSMTAIFRSTESTPNGTNIFDFGREFSLSRKYNSNARYSASIRSATYDYVSYIMASDPTDIGKNDLHIITVQWKATETFEFWVNGNSYASVFYSSAGSGWSSINDNYGANYYLCNRSNFGSHDEPNKLYMALTHKNRWLSPEEIRSLHSDPYQFLIPA